MLSFVMSLILIRGKYMSRKRTIPLFLVLFIASVLMIPTAAADASSSRTLPASANVGAPITVNIVANDYGTIGSVVETIPNGFTYVSSTLSDSQVVVETDNVIRFNLMGEPGFDYTVTASSSENTYAFSGIIKDDYLDEFSVGGDTSIILLAETVEEVNDPTPDEQTSDPITNEQVSDPEVQTTQSPSVDPDVVDEDQKESTANDNPVDDTSTESSKSVKTTPSTESTEDIPATESTPFIATFGIIMIGVIATLVHKLKK